MLSSIKSKSVCLLLILVLTIFFLPTAFCDTKSEASTSGTTGVLSIGPDGNIYIQFTESHVSHLKSTVGDLIMGDFPLEELTQTQADQHEFQKAAYIAYEAWLKCEEAKKKAANGKITQVQMEFECARYNVKAAEEVLIWATAILNNNLGSEIELAAPISEISKLEIEKGNQELSDLIDLGAEPTAEGYEPPDFTTDVIPFNTSDPIIVSDKFVIDSLPIKDEVAASPQ